MREGSLTACRGTGGGSLVCGGCVAEDEKLDEDEEDEGEGELAE